MLKLSKKMLFAIEAVLDIAYHAGAKPVQSREITRRQGIPKRYLEQALQGLVREKVLIGVRGPRGGYQLARERRRITIGEIVRVVRLMELKQSKATDPASSELGTRIVRPLWAELEKDLMEKLDNTTIDDLCSRADKLGIVSEGRQNLDFII